MAILRLIRYKNLIIIALFQYLIRYNLIIPILHHYGYEPALSDFRFILLVISSVLLAASGYVINDYFDIKIDRLNRPDKMVVGKKMKRREAMFFHVILTFCGVFIGLFLSYVTRKETWALIFLIIPAFLWYYSTTFKKQGFIGNIVVSGLTALVGIIVVSLEFGALQRIHGSKIINSEACSTAWFWTLGFSFFAFITSLIREIVKDMEDMEGDQIQGCQTIPIAIGTKYSKILVALITSFTITAVWTLYFYIDKLNNSWITALYFSIFITLPFLLSFYFLYKANKSKSYHFLSSLYKFIMLAGVLFIFVTGYLF